MAQSAGRREPLLVDDVLELLGRHVGRQQSRKSLSHLIAFDILTANCDRHWHNWGVLLPPPGSFEVSPVVAHFYDNGSSLGSNLMEDRLQRYCDEPSQRSRFDRKFSYEIRVCRDRQPNIMELLEILRSWNSSLFGFIDEVVKSTNDRIDELIQTAGNCWDVEARRDFSRHLLRRRRNILLEKESEDI